MSINTPDQYRAGFEAWARDNRYEMTKCGEGSRIGPPSAYMNTATAHAWDVWVAAKRDAIKQSSANFEDWARANGHPIRKDASGNYLGMNEYRFEGYVAAQHGAGVAEQTCEGCLHISDGKD